MTNIIPDTPRLHRIVSFSLWGGYTIRLLFDDGTEQVVDLEPILSGPLFGPLHDPAMFRQVELDADFGALVWPNGADIDPMVLYHWLEYLPDLLVRRRAIGNPS
jgi:hypothetical protein